MTATPKKPYMTTEIEGMFVHEAQKPYPQIENCLDIIIFTNAEGIVTYVSPSITILMGYASEKIVGCHLSLLVHPDDLDTMQRMSREVRQMPDRSLSAECRLCCKDGSWRWFEGSQTNLLHVPGIGAVIGNFRDITERKLAPHLSWSEMRTSEHFVQFYETDEFLLDSVAGFIGTGLDVEHGCIVVATQAHREQLEKRLKAEGVDVETARARGEYIALDAVETLAKFMVDGLPEPGRFAQVIGGVIARAAKGHAHVRIFGEMVAHLWTEGNQAAAVRLEELWNDLGITNKSFSLFCGYSMHGFNGETNGAQFSEICKQHSRVIPDESYSSLTSPDERLRTITFLQQRANSLEVEIAERKAAEQRLLVSENNYRQLFDSNLIGVFVSDFDGAFLEANYAFLNLLGYTLEELQAGAVLRDALTPPEFRHLSQNAVKALRETGSSGAYEKEYLHKNGKRIPVLVAVTRIDQTETCIGFVLDISERKELDKRKDEFISMASHELKTPVTSLKGFLSLLQRRLSVQEDEKALHYLGRMDAQVNKLTKLINDLLDLSKMQTGQLSYREERFEMDGLVQEIVENIQETTRTHHLLLEGQTRAEVFGDRDRIGQVLINLLNNAIKYSPGADKVQVYIQKDQSNIFVSVRDFGIGIAQEHQLKIFERFYQVTEPEEKTYPGLGIGLYISCEIIRRHNGQMWVESEKGKGATFHFTLPLVEEVKNQVSL